MEQIKLTKDKNNPILVIVFPKLTHITMDKFIGITHIELSKQEIIELNLKLTKWLLENNDLE